VTGPPVSIPQGVSMDPTFGSADFSLSTDGSLAYVSGGSRVGERTLLWVDRNGGTQPLPAPPRGYLSPRLSPDGQRLAVGIQGTNPGLWLYELTRGTLTRLTRIHSCSLSDLDTGRQAFDVEIDPNAQHLLDARRR